jgi:hypothetical protein
MHWLHPPKEKIYEALGALADGRVEKEGNTARVYSSSRNKLYTVEYDPDTQSIMANDNASFYREYLGYPAIAFLMMIGELLYRPKVAELLKGIPWKDLNEKYKHDFEETVEHVFRERSAEERRMIEGEVRTIEEQLRQKHYSLLGQKVRPPEGY